MRKIFLSALTALSLGSIANPAVAETTSITVPYGDLDLSSPQGSEALEGRIEAAAKRICGKIELRRVTDGTDQQRCMRETHASVSVEIARLTGKQQLVRR